MKKLIIFFAIGLFSINSVFANTGPNLTKEIKEKVNVDLVREGIEFSDRDFVKVSFIVQEGKIIILEMNSTQEGLRDLIIRELEEIRIQSEYGFNQTYYFKFSFKLE